MTSWWVRLCKPRIRQLCRQEEAARWRDFRQLENFCYECIYEIVKDRDNMHRAFSALNHMRAKIVQLNSRKLHMKLYDNEPSELNGGETPTLYQIVRRHKRTKNRLIRSVRDEEGNIQTSQLGIVATFLRFFRTKYENLATHQESTRTLASYNKPVRLSGDRTEIRDILYTLRNSYCTQLRRPK
jgi:hypothetical protein